MCCNTPLGDAVGTVCPVAQREGTAIHVSPRDDFTP